MAAKYPTEDNAEEIDQHKEGPMMHLSGLLENENFTPECEVVFEAGGRTLEKHYKNCAKNPGHPTFIPVNGLSTDHLPPELKNRENIMDLIRARVDQTVRVRIPYTSLHRPDFFWDSKLPYPYAEYKGKDYIRYGTGSINRLVTPDPVTDKPCPCVECKTSGEPPKMTYCVLTIRTSTHVIYDDSEAEKSTFDCFFDSDGMDGVYKLYGLHLEAGNATPRTMYQSDLCEVVCVAHDIETIQKLTTELFRSKLPNGIPGILTPANPPSEVIVSHPHGRSKRITFGKVKYLTVPVKPSYTTNTPFRLPDGSKCKPKVEDPPVGHDEARKSNSKEGNSETISQNNESKAPNSEEGNAQATSQNDKPKAPNSEEEKAQTTSRNDKFRIPSPEHGKSRNIPQNEKPRRPNSEREKSLATPQSDETRTAILEDENSRDTSQKELGTPTPNLKGSHTELSKSLEGQTTGQSLLGFQNVDSRGQDNELTHTSTPENDFRCDIAPPRTKLSETECQQKEATLPQIHINSIVDAIESSTHLWNSAIALEMEERYQDGNKTRIDSHFETIFTDHLKAFGFSFDTIQTLINYATEIQSKDHTDKNKVISNVVVELIKDMMSKPDMMEQWKSYFEIFISEFGPKVEALRNSGQLCIPEILRMLFGDFSKMYPLLSSILPDISDVMTFVFGPSFNTSSFENSEIVDVPSETTFTLPQGSEYAMRYYNDQPGWFQFPPGTKFITKEGDHLPIPDGAQFKNPFFIPEHFFAVYDIDTCPGCSGAAIYTYMLQREQITSCTHSCQTQNGNNRSGVQDSTFFSGLHTCLPLIVPVCVKLAKFCFEIELD